jgi:hypothetical protein
MAYPNGSPKVFTMGPAAVDEILATSTTNYKKTLADNIYVKVPTLNFLKKKGKKSSKVVSGVSLGVPVVYRKNTTAKMYAADDELDITGQNNYTMAQYLWKQGSVTVKVNGLEAAINSGEQAIIDLVSARLKDAEKSGSEMLSTELFLASPTSRDLISLPSLIDASSNVGDIDSSTYSWWQANVTTSGSFAAQGLSDMRGLYNTCSQYDENDTPDVIITTQAAHQYYEGVLQPQERFMNTDKADAGFMKLMFKGLPIVWDPKATSGVMYFLNTNHVELSVSSSRDFEPGKWIEPDNQDSRVCKLLWMGVLYSDARRYLGKMTTISA